MSFAHPIPPCAFSHIRLPTIHHSAPYPHLRLSALNMSALFISAFSRAKNVPANLGSREHFPREYLHAMDSEILGIDAEKQRREKHDRFYFESAMKFIMFTTARRRTAFLLEGFCF